MIYYFQIKLQDKVLEFRTSTHKFFKSHNSTHNTHMGGTGRGTQLLTPAGLALLCCTYPSLGTRAVHTRHVFVYFKCVLLSYIAPDFSLPHLHSSQCSPIPISFRFTAPLFLFRKERESQESKPSLAQQVTVRLDTNPPVRAEGGKPVGEKGLRAGKRV